MQQHNWRYRPFPQSPFTPEVPYSGYGSLDPTIQDELGLLQDELAQVKEMLDDPNLRDELKYDLRNQYDEISDRIETIENIRFRQKAKKLILPVVIGSVILYAISQKI